MPKNLATQKSRISFIDIVRGILIILVIVGHTNFRYSEYIYWFHMPAFFILSGSLYKPRAWREICDYLKKTFNTLFVPYLYNFALITIVGIIIGLLKLSDLRSLLIDLAYGGTYLIYIYGVFWFVSTFAISRVIFAVTEATLPKYLKWPLYIAMYYLAHRLAHLLPAPGTAVFDPWWSPRYYLLGVPYLAIGYLLKEKITNFRLSPPALTVAACLYLGLVYLKITQVFYYHFDWKYGIHNSLILDILVPCLGLYLVLSLGRLITKSKPGIWLAWVGERAMYIMYWHLLILARLGI